MAVTNVREIRNMSSFTANVFNREHPPDTDGKGQFNAGESRPINMAVPWCADGQGFATKHIDVVLTQRAGNADTVVRTFSIWQAQHATDRVRVSLDGKWHDPGDEIGGYAAVGPLEEFSFGDDRVLFINDASLWLLPTFLVNPLEDMAKQTAAKGYRICGEAARPPIASVPQAECRGVQHGGDSFRRF